MPQHVTQDFGGQTRSPLEKMPIQPKSMVQHPAYMTPVGRRSLALAGRGRRAAEDGGPIWQPKVRGKHNAGLDTLCDFARVFHDLVHQWWILVGPTLGKLIQRTSLMSKMPGDPWRELWPCRDQGVKPVGFAGAVQLWLNAYVLEPDCLMSALALDIISEPAACVVGSITNDRGKPSLYCRTTHRSGAS